MDDGRTAEMISATPNRPPLSFRPVERADLAILRGWHNDHETARQLSFPTDDWFAWVTERQNAHCWLALIDGRVVGFVQLDCEGTAARGYLAMAIAPQERGRGLGQVVLRAFLRGPGRTYERIEGFIAPDNHASLTCFRRCGFEINAATDADGMLAATFRQPRKR